MKYRFGEKLRALRERRQMTLKDVAERAGVSESLVSQIERNRVSPAMDTLLSLVDVLDVDIEHFFSEYRRERDVRIVRRKDRNSFTRPGVVYERLAALEGSAPGAGIEAYEITIQPGASTGSESYGHEGLELGLVVEGSADLTLGNRTHRLDKGDSASFSSDHPHRVANAGQEPLRLFWIVTPPKRDAAARS